MPVAAAAARLSPPSDCCADSVQRAASRAPLLGTSSWLLAAVSDRAAPIYLVHGSGHERVPPCLNVGSPACCACCPKARPCPHLLLPSSKLAWQSSVTLPQLLPPFCAADGAVRVFDTYAGTCAKLLRLHHGGVAALQHVRHGELDLLVRCAVLDVEACNPSSLQACCECYSSCSKRCECYSSCSVRPGHTERTLPQHNPLGWVWLGKPG